VISGLLSRYRSPNNSRKFVAERGISPVTADGFLLRSEWRDSLACFIKLGRGGKSASWHQPATFSTKYQLAIIADARLNDRMNLVDRLNLDAADKPSDVELILAAYRKWGRDCPQYLIGDYAFAIWDPATSLLFCARDHIGTRPFFYSDEGQEFAFASDIRIILDASDDGFELAKDLLIASLDDWKLSDPEPTYYHGVKSLLPGHSLVAYSNGKIDIRRYWYPEKTPPLRLANDGEYAEALREQIDRAVADSLTMAAAGMADGYARELGVHMSGGLDSSAVTSLAIRHLQQQGRAKPEAFCWQPEPTETNMQSAEHAWLRAMVQKEGLTLNYAQADDELAYKFYMHDGTRIPLTSTYTIEAEVQQQAHAKNIGVMLSGWGGDELSSHNGRSYYPWLFRSGRWGQLISNLRDFDQSLPKSFLAQCLIPQVPGGLREWVMAQRASRRQAGNASDNDSVKAKSLLHPGISVDKKLKKARPSSNCSVKDMQLFLLNNGHMTERIESWAFHGRKLGLEYRYPLLDRRVIEFALSVPAAQYKRGRWKRFIFRNAMRGILPDTVVDNLSKDEPVRCELSSSVEKQAMKRIAREIRAGQLKVGRAEFVDMERLLTVMEGKTKERSGAARQALEILQFS
jgi:asparagine synthase (glutamine-hydrolysing)